MAQIVAFPVAAQYAASTSRRDVVEALAQFERMLAHQAELERRTQEFKALCEQAFLTLSNEPMDEFAFDRAAQA